MIKPCGHCGKPIDTSYGNYQRSPDYEGEVFCWNLAGGRDNCLEQHRLENEVDKEEESCVEGELHTENSGDYCPRCGTQIKTDWTGGN